MTEDIKKKIYFDNASTTQVRKEVVDKMMPYFEQFYGNPSGLNKYSKESKKAVEKSREILANIIGAQPGEIIFTSGGTESNNLAIQGFVRNRDNKTDHIITSTIEHDSVLKPCLQLEKEGWDLHLLKVDKEGFILLDEFDILLKPETVFVSVMHANNEIGTIQEIKNISSILKDKNIIFHTDAVQTFGKLPFNINDLNIDMASLSSHKIYGPKGIGALYVRKGISLRPLLFGGGQEWNLRSGTLSVPLIVGFAEAARLAIDEMNTVIPETVKLQKYLIDSLVKIKHVKLNGAKNIEKRLPGNINISIDGLEGESLMLHLNLKDIAVSTGSSCSSGKLGMSKVLKAIGEDSYKNFTSIRISLGKDNTIEDCNKFINSFKNILNELKINQSSY
ncbi:MAG: cysteine desulfurase family protein [Cyanobacteriota bacterium]